MPLLVATTNPGKLREVRAALAGVVEVRTLGDLPAVPEPEETGGTFAANALLKATYYARRLHSGRAAPGADAIVAEDSGLSIDALGGAPGVLSARYPGATYPEKFAALYEALAGHPRPWKARYVCAIALVDPNGLPLFRCERAVHGQIAEAPKGSRGFGYDPIFFYRPYGRTFGETLDADKLAVSHRGRAFRQLRDWLCVTRPSWLPISQTTADRR